MQPYFSENEVSRRKAETKATGDQYLLTVPEGSNPAGFRLGMYRSDPEAGFINTPWLSLQLPER